ncbi:MAG TPA: alpha-amylase family glycosyl hydrolase [Candidatus Xenobia bacterium]|jgi:1,4-alpha-glucan branching enzyme
MSLAVKKRSARSFTSPDRQLARVELTLFAPYNRAASVAGDFSQWQDVPMKKGPDGRFRASFLLPDGRYEYRFKVRSKSWFFKPNEWVEIVDPYATAVDPTGKSGILTIAGGQHVVDSYCWKHDNVRSMPQNHQLVIYELHIGDFGGSFAGTIDKLDYLSDLGINAIELMPVKDNPGQYSWGYNPRHFFAVDTNYGTSEDLKRLVDECHARGMRVFVDKVYNHAETGSPLAHIDHDYWFRHEPKDKEFSWGPEFNCELWDEKLGIWPARQFILDAITFWVREYHLDGIRYDATRQLDNFDAMRDFAAAAHEAAGQKPFYNVAEHIPQDPAITNFDGPMDAAWHDSFYYCILEHMTKGMFDIERLKSVIDGRREGFGAAINMVNYCSNHDHNHLLADLGDHGVFDEAAFTRRRQGAILCFTALGVPLLWMGEEFGEYSERNESGFKMHWDLLESPQGQSLHCFYQTLIRLRTTHPALQTDNIDFFYEHVDHRVLGYFRWAEELGIVVLANFSLDLVMADISNFPPGCWLSPFDGNEREGSEQHIQLRPLETRLWVSLP